MNEQSPPTTGMWIENRAAPPHQRTRKRREEPFTAAEKRSARARRILVSEASLFGWTARSEINAGERYHLFREPTAKNLVCACRDFIFRGNSNSGYSCKHVLTTLRFIGSLYLQTEYDPRAQFARISA